MFISTVHRLKGAMAQGRKGSKAQWRKGLLELSFDNKNFLPGTAKRLKG
jgi:hypothetical protein